MVGVAFCNNHRFKVETKTQHMEEGKAKENGTSRKKATSDNRKAKKEKTKNDASESTKKSSKHKRMKKSIFISYSSDSSFSEKRFATDLVQQIKENNLADDIWFDKDENVVDEPFWLSSRLEIADKCRAIVMLLSKDYMSCPVTVYETKIILERISSDTNMNKPFVFCVLLDTIQFSADFADCLLSVNAEIVDLSGALLHASVEERTSWAVGALSDKLDKIALIKSPYISPSLNSDSREPGSWTKKKVIQWTSSDVVEWLYSLQIREFFRQSFAEKNVTGYLLLSTTDRDLQWNLGIDSRIVRKKITSELARVMKHELGLPQSWHLRHRSIIPRVDCVYLAYDPQDARLAATVKGNLIHKGMQVLSHDKLGQSREEFLQLNGEALAKSTFVICLMTEAAAVSPFIFHELLFYTWMGGNRSVVTLLFKNVWNKLKTPMRAILGDFPAIDFEKNLYSEGMSILEHHINPKPILPGIVLEQRCLEKFKEGVQSMQVICTNSMRVAPSAIHSDDAVTVPKVFITYQWDVQDKVLQMVRFLNSHGVPCWSDVMLTPHFSSSSVTRSSSRAATSYGWKRNQSNTLQTHIHGNMKLQVLNVMDHPITNVGNVEHLLVLKELLQSSKVVVCCLTPKYVVCQNCEQDLLLALSLGKPILPVMFQYIAWPPEMAGERVKRMLVQLKRPIDLSNDKLFRVNLPLVLQKVSSYLL